MISLPIFYKKLLTVIINNEDETIYSSTQMFKVAYERKNKMNIYNPEDKNVV